VRIVYDGPRARVVGIHPQGTTRETEVLQALETALSQFRKLNELPRG
jgi:hypothetical protein